MHRVIPPNAPQTHCIHIVQRKKLRLLYQQQDRERKGEREIQKQKCIKWMRHLCISLFLHPFVRSSFRQSTSATLRIPITPSIPQ